MSEKKFKVGDRVKCIRNTWSIPILNEYGTVCNIIEDFFGSYVVGINFDKYIDGHSCSGHCKDGYGWNLEPSEIKLVEENWKVLIMPDGDKTTGRLYENGKVVKSVETKKHPDDEYSIDKACEVIMERLFPKTPTIVKQDKYEIGDKVKVRDDLVRGRSYEMSNGNVTDSVVAEMFDLKDSIVTIIKTHHRLVSQRNLRN